MVVRGAARPGQAFHEDEMASSSINQFCHNTTYLNILLETLHQKKCSGS